MKNKNSNIIARNKDIASVFIMTAAILMLPLLAMIFDWQVPEPGYSISSEVDWGPFDFVVMGTLLSGTGLLIVLALRKIKDTPRWAAIIIALLLAFLLIWAELAVGIFGSPFAGS